jgi:hypothetical protein
MNRNSFNQRGIAHVLMLVVAVGLLLAGGAYIYISRRAAANTAPTPISSVQQGAMVQPQPDAELPDSDASQKKVNPGLF